MSSARPIQMIAASSVAAIVASALLVTPTARAAQTDDARTTGPLQNSAKSRYVGMSTTSTSWVDTVASPSDVTYPRPGDAGVVEVGGTCVSRATRPTAGVLSAVAVGDGSSCLTFRAEVTKEGFFTFKVDTPGAQANGQYLGDGDRGGVLDLISTTPLVLFALPEEPAGTVALGGTATDTDDDDRLGAGDELEWTVSIENSGNVRLRGLDLTLADGTPVSCPEDVVDAGKTLECTARRTLTQDDIDRGTVSTTVTATATTPRGTEVDLGSAEGEVTVSGALDVTATVTSDLGSAPSAGDSVTYTIPVRNSGTRTLTDLTVTPSVGRAEDCDVTTLAPGATATCRVVRELTQADVDSGAAAFSADVVASAADGSEATTAVKTDERIATSASATVAATSDAGASVQAGQTIAYTTTVTNTGTVTLSDVAAQPTIGDAATCAQTSLAPGASTTCDVTYTATQHDVDAGAVDQAITVVGSAPRAESAQLGVAEVHDVAVGDPAVDASVVTDAGEIPAVGDVVTATITVTNTGNVTLSDVTADPSTGAAVTCVDLELAPGATTSCIVTRAPLTQADVDSGALDFSADVLATVPSGDRSVLGRVGTTDLVPASPAASASMTSDAGQAPAVGQTVTWTTVVTNTGNVTVSDLVVDVAGGTADCPVTVLEPGKSVSCTTSAEVTQADVDAGTLDRDAIVSGAAPRAAAAELTRASSADVIAPAPAVSTAVVSDVSAGTRVGDPVTWTVTATNTGNVTLSALALGSGNCDPGMLAPGAAADCTVVRDLTQADVDAGVVRLDEGVSATTPAGATAELPRARGEGQVAQRPALGAMSVSDADDQPTLGDTVTVTVAVENTGNVTIHDVGLRPARGEAAACDPTTLAPGATAECRIRTTVTQEDVDAGGFPVETAVLGSTPTEEGAQLASTSVQVDVPAKPAATLGLAAVLDHRLEVGTDLTVEATVTNTGNVTLSDLALSTPDDQTVSCPSGAVAPGASVTCTVTVAVTRALVDAGRVDFHVTGSASVPAGDRTDVPAADLTVPIDAEPGAALTLTAVPGEDVARGSVVHFDATIANSGTVTLDELAMSRLVAFGAGRSEDDPALECTDGVVPVGGTVMCSFDRTVTQADVDAGSIRETVTAAASTPADESLHIAPASVAVQIPRTVEGATSVSADTEGPVAEGDQVTLTTTVRNVGTVTLRDLVARDGEHDQACDATDLAPGEETTCVSTRTVTTADVQRGSVRSTISTSAVDPQGNRVDLPDATLKIPAAAPAELAFTGADGLARTAGVALVLALLGVITMLLRGRRRATSDEQR